LTFNNTENQIILYALSLILKQIRQQTLRYECLKNYQMLSDLIDNVEFGEYIFNRIGYNTINAKYRRIHNLCKFIVKNSYIKDLRSNKGFGFNFIVDMNKMYEFFVTEMIKKAMSSICKEISVIPQHSVRTLVSKGKKFTTRPDILLEYKGKKFMVIDVKYKDCTQNSDFYQLVAYTLAYEELNQGLLLYEKFSSKESYSFIETGDNRLEIYFTGLNILSDLKESDTVEKFEQVVVDKIKSKFRETLNGTNTSVEELIIKKIGVNS